MSRGLPAALLTAFQAGTLTAIHLVEVQTGRAAPNDVLRFSDWDQDVVFPAGGDAYSSRFADVAAGPDLFPVWTEGLGDDGTGDLRIPDGDALLRGHLDAGAWAARQLCYMTRIDAAQVDSGTKVLRNLYVIEGWEARPREMVFHLANLPALFARVQIPKGIVSRGTFPGLPPEA